MYSISAFGDMITDETRMDAYVAALQRGVTADTVVLDIGTGTGIFALLACQFGARHVYAVEPGDAIHVARRIAQENGYADRITFIQDLSSNITLPEPADLIISDLRGVLPLFEAHIPAIVDARQRHLAADGRLIPQQDTLWAAIVTAPEQYNEIVKPWDHNKYHLPMRAARQIVINLWGRVLFKPEQLLVLPQSWATLDYRCITTPDISATLRWTAQREGVAHGLVLWFDATLAEDICISNAPGLPELVYGQAFFPWTEPVLLSPGDEITVTLQAALVGDDYTWRWDTQVMSQAEAGHGVDSVKARFSQSTLTGTVLSPAQLVKNAAHYVAVLSPEGEIDRFILKSMDGKQSLGQIAGALMQAFPDQFDSWGDALGRVGKLSQAYSR